jgi:hypothetical protein
MPTRKHPILSPIADVFMPVPAHDDRPRRSTNSARPIGLLNNSKPNVAWFMQGLTRELSAAGEPDIVSIAKPRSAGPAPDIASLAGRCRFVVNAVGD